MRKYLFEFQELRVPTGILEEHGKMVGVRFSRTEVADGQVRTIPGTEAEVRAELTVSSVGSIPEPIAGIPQRGEVYQYTDLKRGLVVENGTAVFAAYSAVTHSRYRNLAIAVVALVTVIVAGALGDQLPRFPGRRSRAPGLL